MQSEMLLALFKQQGLIIGPDHFVFSSGVHGNYYCNVKGLFEVERRPLLNLVLSLLATKVIDDDGRPDHDFLIGPDSGGWRLAKALATTVTAITNRHLTPVRAEKDGNGGFVINPLLLEAMAGKNVAVVEDVVTTGNSAYQPGMIAHEAGANVGLTLAVAAGADRAAKVCGRLISLVNQQVEYYWPNLGPRPSWSYLPVNEQYGHGRNFSQLTLQPVPS